LNAAALGKQPCLRTVALVFDDSYLELRGVKVPREQKHVFVHAVPGFCQEEEREEEDLTRGGHDWILAMQRLRWD
jgi:hypothetical protein